MTRSAGDEVQAARRFHLKRRIGAGAFGEVYLAEQVSGAGFSRRVALKVLHREVSKSKSAAQRMRDEARILGRLSHRHIVSALDLVRIDDRWVVVMDYVEGADLEQVLHALRESDGQFPAPAALGITAAVARALDAAWRFVDGEAGPLRVVHRDIKPSNIRLTPDGDVKVLDFGVARVELEGREASTRVGAFIGTELYMAPERMARKADSHAGDVYALAATLAELLLREPLGRTPVFTDEHVAFVTERLAVIAERLPDTADGRAVLDLLRAGLHAEPDARPDAAAFADAASDLARTLDGEPLDRFAPRAVAEVAALLGHQGEPVTGTLSEAISTGQASDRGITSMGDGTYAMSQMVPAPHAPTAVDPGADDARRRRGGGLLFAAAAVGVVALAVGGFAATQLLGGEIGDTTLPPTPAASVAAAVSPDGAPDAAAPTEAAAAPVPTDAADPTEATAAPVPTEASAPPEPAPASPAAPATDDAAPAAEPPPSARARGTADAPEPRPTTPPPAAAASKAPPPAPAPVDPDAPRISRAQVSVPNASALTVRCGDRTASGTASVRITDFPAGACRVEATYLGQPVAGSVDLDRPIAVRCTTADGGLTCAP